MADKLHFDLVAPEARVFRGDVDMVVVPGSEGDFGVLAGHAPFMSTIRSGAIAIHDGAQVTRTFIHGGFAEVTPDGLTILAEEAIDLTEIDPAEVERQLTEAREERKSADGEAHEREAQVRIDKLEALMGALRN
ncbi:MAG: F0F1 ATP synthase subunit epsilon [Oceanicaulis sp.]